MHVQRSRHDPNPLAPAPQIRRVGSRSTGREAHAEQRLETVRQLLRDHGGRLTAAALAEAAEQLGVNDRTLRRWLKAAGAVTFKDGGGGWVWSLERDMSTLSSLSTLSSSRDEVDKVDDLDTDSQEGVCDA